MTPLLLSLLMSLAPGQAPEVPTKKLTAPPPPKKATLPRAKDPVILPLAVTGDDVRAVTVAKLPFTVKAPAGGAIYTWAYPAGVEATDMNDALLVAKAPAGEVKFSAKVTTADWDKKQFVTTFYQTTVWVGDLVPPPPPVPPTPPVPPAPPAPVVPIKAAGRHVMIYFDDSKLNDMPQPQQAVISGVPIRSYIAAKVDTDVLPSGAKQSSLRIWDRATVPGGDVPWTHEAMAFTPPEYPWIVVANNGAGTSEKLPPDVESTKALVNKYLP